MLNNGKADPVLN